MTIHEDRTRLRAILTGFQATQAVHVAARIGLADHIGDSERTADEIAILSQSDPGALQRLAFALVALGVLRRADPDRFALTSMGQLLRRNTPGTQAHRATLMGQPYFWRAWEALNYSVETGQRAFDAMHGTDCWTWRNRHPEDGALFDAAMTADAEWMGEAIAEAYDFSQFDHIVDIGGGDGRLLCVIADRIPALTGTVLEQPRVAEIAADAFVRAGLHGRLSAIGGDFFADVPAGADAYILKWVLHNWPDELSTRLLNKCREAMRPGSRLLICEHIADMETPVAADVLMDLNMLVMNGGRERTIVEFETLLSGSGLKLINPHPTSAGLTILEAAPN